MANKKYSILTYIFGNYEFVREPLEIDNDCEYILVTDNKSLTSKNWKIVYLDSKFDGYTPISKTFYVRYHPFDFITTDTVFLLDGSMEIRKNLNKLFKDFNNGNYDCALGTFPQPIKSIDELYSYWIKYRNYEISQAEKSKAFLRALKVNNMSVYHETGYMLFKNNSKCLQFLEFVYSSIKRISIAENNLDRLDQPIFNGILYTLCNDLNVLSLSRELIQSSYIQYYKHNTLNKLVININKNFVKNMYSL